MLTVNKRTYYSDLTENLGMTIPPAYGESLGDVRESGGNYYILVKNNSGISLAQGDVVCWDMANGTAKHSYIYVPTAARLNLFAGIIMCSETVAANEHCWILVDGYASGVDVSRAAAEASIAAGALYRLGSVDSASAGYLIQVGSNVTAAGYSTAAQGNICGTVLASVASHSVTDSTVSSIPMRIRFKEI